MTVRRMLVWFSPAVLEYRWTGFAGRWGAMGRGEGVLPSE